MNSEFDKRFIFTSFSLKFIGAHPFRARDITWYFQFGIFQFFATFQLFTYTYSLITYDIHYNLTNSFADMCLIIVYFVVGCKYFVMLRYEKVFVQIFNIVNDHYDFYKTQSNEEQMVIAKYIKIAQNAEKCWTFMTTSCVLGFLGQPVLTMMYLAFYGKFELIPVFNLHYPAWIRNLDFYLVYTVMFILAILHVLYCTITYTAVVPLGPSFMFHACGQMTIIKMKVETLFSEEKMLSKKERAEKIKDVAKQIQGVYDFVDLLATSLMILYEMTLKGTSLIMPVLLFAVIEALKQGIFRTEFMAVLLGSLVISSIPCYAGEMLLGKSEELRDALYACGWEKEWDKSARMSLQLMICRMEHPTVIRSIFRTISLDSLAEVFRTAYSLFSLINAAYEA